MGFNFGGVNIFVVPKMIVQIFEDPRVGPMIGAGTLSRVICALSLGLQAFAEGPIALA
jgi:hypothetical protein